jgi:hypothetical protein
VVWLQHHQRVISAVIVVLAAFGAAAASLGADLAKPTLSVVLERSTLLAGQNIPAYVWMANPTDQEITPQGLRLSAPNYIHLGVPSGDGGFRCNEMSSVSIARLPAKSASGEPVRICLSADRSVEEQDVTVAFSVGYSAAGGSDVLLIEKSLSIGLFGTESVAGVSLRLMSLVLPGFLMLLVMRWAKVPYVVDLDSTQLATFAVLTSITLTWGRGFLAGAHFYQEWFGTTPRGVSSGTFLGTCLVAVGLAVLVSGLVRWRIAKKAGYLTVLNGEDKDTEFLKALRAKKTSGEFCDAVSTKDGAVYVGSASAANEQNGIVLFGWFEMSETTEAASRAELKALIDKRKVLVAANLGRSLNLSLTHAVTGNIKQQDGAEFKPTLENRKVFAVADILSRQSLRCEDVGVSPGTALTVRA